MDTDQSPVHVSKLGYVGFQTQDLDRMVEHYTGALGFALVDSGPDRAFLTTTFDHHCLVLERAETVRSRRFVGFQVAEELGDAERRLREAGYAVELRSDVAPATPRVLVVQEAGTGTPLHLYDAQSGSGASTSEPLRPLKLGHVAGYTADLPAVQRFYQDVLGFRWSDSVEDFFVFLRCNTDHHAANFVASSKYRDLHHIAYEMRDLDHLQAMLDRLAACGVRLEWGPGRHGPGHNVFTYHRDPDGNLVELFTQLDLMADEALGYFEPRPWHEDSPQRPKTWGAELHVMNSWGPVDLTQLDR